MRGVRRNKRWYCVCIGFTTLVIAITILAVTRFNFPQTSWIGRLKGVWGADQENEMGHVRPQIIAHRGAGIKSTESGMRIGNTMKGIKDALPNANWIEIDIRESSDGTFMVFHDEYLDRVTYRNGPLHDLTADQLQQLSIRGISDEKIPTLEEVLEECCTLGARFILDIKFISNPGAEAADAKRLLETVDKYTSRDQVILFGRFQVLQYYKGSGVRLGYTALGSEGWNKYRFLFGHQFILDRCRELDCDYLILPSAFLNQSLVDESRRDGHEVWAYGIDNARDWLDSVRCGVSGLIVDDLHEARKSFPVRDMP